MNNIYLLISILFLTSCGRTQNIETKVSSFEDFFESMEDPSILQQKKLIKKNGIKQCTILKWKHSSNNDTLELQNDSTLIYYNKLGQIDSIITAGYNSSKKYNYYNLNQQLEKRLLVTSGLKYIDNTFKNITDTTTYTFNYDGKNLKREIIESSDIGTLIIDYSWSKGMLEKMIIDNKTKKPTKSYSFDYKNGTLILRKAKSLNNDPLTNKSNNFNYKNGKLLEITNTWIMANDSVTTFNTEEEKEQFTNVTNTKYSYYDSGLIKSLQKVYGMWPGESFWITTFSYLDNDLIKEKEMSNDGEFGLTKIILKYKYKSR